MKRRQAAAASSLRHQPGDRITKKNASPRSRPTDVPVVCRSGTPCAMSTAVTTVISLSGKSTTASPRKAARIRRSAAPNGARRIEEYRQVEGDGNRVPGEVEPERRHDQDQPNRAEVEFERTSPTSGLE